MRKQQWILISTAILLFLGLYLFGNTVNPDKPATPAANTSEKPASNISTQDVLLKYKQGLNAAQVQKLTQLENSVVRGDVHSSNYRCIISLLRIGWIVYTKRN